VEAANGIRRFFRVALPLHEADEESSVAPRLLEARERAPVEDALALMVSQHVRLHDVLAELDPLWATIADEPSAIGRLARPILENARRLEDLFTSHMTLEETVIFPLIRTALVDSARSEIVAEMRARRGHEAFPRDLAAR
jgi:iron-sulfur cluster repair protein YtfE (RIC family)